MTAGQPSNSQQTAAHDIGQSLWQSCVDQLAQELPEQQFNTWIKPLYAHVHEDFSRITIFVANRFKLDWVRAQYSGRISGMLEKLYGQAVIVELAITPRETIARPQFSASASETPVAEDIVEIGEDRNLGTPKNRLNGMLTFETLVEGTANRMARAAAMHVATMPGHLYNPLFIYGGVGLGKTHLMHAVGNRLLQDKPGCKVLYIHAEQFVSDVVKAYQRKTFDEFKDRYHSLDLLLIDDVQFFANKDRTQEEFFNAFEALLTKKSHIVMTSDTYPKGLADIHERLVSRFDSGLTVAIEPPELEMRVAILINKARVEGSEMPEKWPSLLLKTCARMFANLKAHCAKYWPIRASTRRKFRLPWHEKPCAICSQYRTVRFPWKTSRKPSPTITRSRSRTCIPRSVRPALPDHARSRCTWPKS